MNALDAIVAHHDDDEDRAELRAAILANARRRFRQYDTATLAERQAQESLDVKLCPSCEQLRPVEDFHRDTTRPDGRQSRCRACRRSSRSSTA